MESQLVEVKFLDWMAQPPEDNPVLLLHWEEHNRIIPVWVGLVEISNFAARESHSQFKRPSMFDVFADTLDMLGRPVLRGQITGIHEGVYIASLVLEGEIELDMRPSDLIYLSDELEFPLYVSHEVADTVSVPAAQIMANSSEESDEAMQDDVEESMAEFAEFLDSIDADDFAAGGVLDEKPQDNDSKGDEEK